MIYLSFLLYYFKEKIRYCVKNNDVEMRNDAIDAFNSVFTGDVNTFRQQFERYLRLYGKHPESRKAIEWLRTRVGQFVPTASFQKNKLEIGKYAKQLIPGKLYLFLYDPKHKDTLPVYDTVPLVLVTSVDGSKSFRGINFHHLPREVRAMIFAELYKITSKTKITGSRVEGQVWEKTLAIAQALGKDNYLSQSIKMYLFNHVQSRFIIVDKKDWALASMLPVARMYTNKSKAKWRGWI